jgi:uncharacterized membrane protein
MMRMQAGLAFIVLLAACTGRDDSEAVATNASANAQAPQLEVSEEPQPTPHPVANEPAPSPEAASACNSQNGVALQVAAVRAVGTEPFWGALTEGRCVRYSTPEDRAGTRVWTKVETAEQRTVWTGALRGQPFVLTVKPEPGCSDGMSDRRYPMKAELQVDGEVRRGCAAPASSVR